MWGNSQICLWVSSGLSWHSLQLQSPRMIGPQEADQSEAGVTSELLAEKVGAASSEWAVSTGEKQIWFVFFFITFSIAQVAAEQPFLNLVIAVTMLSGNYCLQMRPESAPYTGVILRGWRRKELSVAFLGWVDVCVGWSGRGADFMFMRLPPGRVGTEPSSPSLRPAI